MNADSTILVGVSGSPASLAALRWAAQEAERTGYQLKVLLIWEREQRASYAQQRDRRDGSDRAEQAWWIATESVTAVLGPGPWRNTIVEAVAGRAERALVGASKDADLLVLGSGPAGPIGPVIRTCLAEARCPVVVVSRTAGPARVVAAEERQLEAAADRRSDHNPAPLPAGAAPAPG